MSFRAAARLSFASLFLATFPLHSQNTPTPQATPLPASAALPAPAPPGTAPTLHIYATRVVLDVVVTDAKGNVVKGLTKDDFKLTDSDEPQTITHFDTSATHIVPPTVTINSTADLDKYAPDAPVNIILLDEFNTRFKDMAFARYSLKKYLAKQPDKLTTPTMLLAVGIDKFSVLHDYTQNKRAILDSLDHHFVAYPWRNEGTSWAPERLATAFSTLEQIAEATIGHPGHKNMIWIGRGFPAIDISNLPPDLSRRIENYVQQCVDMLRDARVTLYSIDPVGLTADPVTNLTSNGVMLDPFGGDYNFSHLAQATGGRSINGRNDVDAQIGSSAEDGENFYTLTYRPTTGAMDPHKFRKIVVTLDRPGLTATTRLGYFISHGQTPVNPSSPSRQLLFDIASASTSSMVYDAVPITLTQDQADRYSLHLRIEGKGLVWSVATTSAPRHANMVISTTTFDKKGKVLKLDARLAQVDAPSTVAPQGMIEVPIGFPIKLVHDPRTVRVRIVVRVVQTGREGSADATLK